MFTGIVREIGEVKSVKRGNSLVRLEIGCPAIRDSLGLGDSVAVDGCDLTVTELTATGFCCDATQETLRRTTIGDLTAGSRVNLEPSLTPSTPISGHLVLGHVDGTGVIRSLNRSGSQAELLVGAPAALMRYVAEKGSITVSGVGLTVVSVGSDFFSCWLVPYTLNNTTLGNRKAGDKVNLEVDILARYVVRALEAGVRPGREGVTEEFLREHGFA